jgi:uncharacterized RDD family membrane protein YckC
VSEHESQVPPEPQVPSPQPPQPTAWQAAGPSGPRASFGRRLVASILDTLILLVGVFIAAAVFNEDVGGIVYLVLAAAYKTVFEGSARGQTPGKMALGIRVIDFNTGGPIGYGRAFIRWLSSILSAIPCYLGYLWMLWDREKQTWHDKLAGSVVVPVEYYPVS